MVEISMAAFIAEKFGKNLDQTPPELIAARLINLMVGTPLEIRKLTLEDNNERRMQLFQMLAIELPTVAKTQGSGTNEQRHFAQIAGFELWDLVDAIWEGKDHPMLKHWLQKRREKGHRLKPTMRGQALREGAVVSAQWFVDCGLTRKQAYSEVAAVANETGVFVEYSDTDRKVTPNAIRRWRENALKPPILAFLQICDQLRLPPKGAEGFEGRTLPFVRAMCRRSLLGLGTSVVGQMLLYGVDVFAGYPESVREWAEQEPE